ncbi:MAG TPA: sulfotransferase [Kineosporiaceae bacterium]|nr:sulfotransferase [Kineosporiaceae bacterium]
MSGESVPAAAWSEAGVRSGAAPVLVTGLPRSGTSWVGKMLQAGGQVVYVNEPLNPRHPPGRSPGVLRADVTHQFQYISAENQDVWGPAFRRTLALRYGLGVELARNHAPYDLARAAKYSTSFLNGRIRGRRALLDDPYAFFSAAWFAQALGVQVVVLIRQPESFVGSWLKLGWGIDFRELLEQPALVRDHLEPYVARMQAAGSDPLERAALLWAAAYDVADQSFRQVPGVHLVRYEDLAADAVTAFGALYRQLGLDYSPGARSAVAAGTSGGGDNRAAFSWSLRGAPSRTAFQAMDSAAAAAAAAKRLDEPAAARVRAITGDVAKRFGYPDPTAG